ncbi:ArgS-related anticodon-binding protein NrtL, partial [Streptomyces filipinensis]|uniref:ArgS-related anticodon-binding protein NrtL n=1 Tax=Streptomyces filipinensis TaxID=66887 RepID=UPI001E4F0EDA
MTPVELSRTVLRAVRCAVEDGELKVTVPERVVVTEPGPGGCGDFATNVALQLARPAGQPPLRVAEILRSRLAGAEGIRDVVVTGPGFLNISLDPQADPVTGLVREIRARGAAYGHGDALAGQVVALRVPYEVRAEVVADAVVRIVATQGGRATVEHGEPANLRPVPAPEDPAPLGPDAARWALLHPAPHDRPRITADHLIQREGNPLFRVRYAHARVRSLSRNAARLGFTAEPGPVGAGGPGGAGSVGESGLGIAAERRSEYAAEPGRVGAADSGLVGAGEPGPAHATESGPAHATEARPAATPGLNPAPAATPGPNPAPGPGPTPDPALEPHRAPTSRLAGPTPAPALEPHRAPTPVSAPGPIPASALNPDPAPG